MVFEFVVAAIVFFGIIMYTISYLSSSVSTFSNELYMNNLETRAIQISELLVHNPGKWVDGEPRVIGLSGDWPVLSSMRIGELQAFCQDPVNYTYLQQNLGLEEDRFGSTQIYNINVRINESNNVLLDCGPSPPEKRMVNVERFALSEGGGILSINVWLW